MSLPRSFCLRAALTTGTATTFPPPAPHGGGPERHQRRARRTRRSRARRGRANRRSVAGRQSAGNLSQLRAVEEERSSSASHPTVRAGQQQCGRRGDEEFGGRARPIRRGTVPRSAARAGWRELVRRRRGRRAAPRRVRQVAAKELPRPRGQEPGLRGVSDTGQDHGGDGGHEEHDRTGDEPGTDTRRTTEFVAQRTEAGGGANGDGRRKRRPFPGPPSLCRGGEAAGVVWSAGRGGTGCEGVETSGGVPRPSFRGE